MKQGCLLMGNRFLHVQMLAILLHIVPNKVVVASVWQAHRSSPVFAGVHRDSPGSTGIHRNCASTRPHLFRVGFVGAPSSEMNYEPGGEPHRDTTTIYCCDADPPIVPCYLSNSTIHNGHCNSTSWTHRTPATYHESDCVRARNAGQLARLCSEWGHNSAVAPTSP